MRRAALLPLVVACSLAAHGPLRAQPPDVAVLALYGGADREQRLVRGARAEREINLYSSLTLEDLNALAAAFDKKYGVKLKFWRAGSEKVVQRIVTEARAGRFDFDVVETNGPELESLHRISRISCPTRSGRTANGSERVSTCSSTPTTRTW